MTEETIFSAALQRQSPAEYVSRVGSHHLCAQRNAANLLRSHRPSHPPAMTLPPSPTAVSMLLYSCVSLGP